MKKLPINEALANYSVTSITINGIIESLWWLDPIINPNCGKIEPTDEYKVDGKLAYADGVNWNPGSGKGLYRYDGSEWVLVG